MSCAQLPAPELKPLKYTPSYLELERLIDRFGGNLHAIARETGRSPQQVNNWINRAPEAMKLHLLEVLAKARATARRAALLRDDLPAFIIPREIKTLVRLYYSLTWDELNGLDIADILAGVDDDPEAPRTLRYKLSWAELQAALADLDAGFNHTFRTTDPFTGRVIAERYERLGGTATVDGLTLDGWNEYALMSWVGQVEQCPIWDRYPDLPDLPKVVIEQEYRDDDGQTQTRLVPYGPHVENALRLLIQRLERYL